MGAKDIQQIRNVWSTKYFAIAMGSIMVVFILWHWITVGYLKSSPRKKGDFIRTLMKFRRATRRCLVPSFLDVRLGRWLLYSVYWAINLILILTNNDLTHRDVAKRLGWISAANLALLVFLALRNTPLAPLSGHSYDKLRPLHKAAGYTCITTTVLHAITYLSHLSETGKLHIMQQRCNIAGAIAGLTMVVLGISTIGWFIRRSYEVFYMVHIVLFLLIMIMVGMHQPQISSSTVVIIIITVCLWLSDRLLRFLKLGWNFLGNHATINPMPDRAIRVKLSRSILCTPGSHAYLWIPSIRWMETHPFTIVSTHPTEFLVRVHNGFTHELYTAALKQPGMVLRCSIDGGYGQIPNFMSFDRIVLIAGGSGASFTFAVARSIIREAFALNVTKKIDFIWCVRYTESLEWFEKELNDLRGSACVNLFLYVTRGNTEPDDLTLSWSTPGYDMTADRSISPNGVLSMQSDIQDVEMISHEKQTLKETSSFHPVKKGRPDIARHMADCFSQCRPEDRVGIGACGPSDMLEATRNILAKGIYDGGPSITLHTEEFGW